MNRAKLSSASIAILPFAGLGGTVVGIIKAFGDIHAEKATGLSAVAGGIVQALVATAVGLLFGMMVVWVYAYVTRHKV